MERRTALWLSHHWPEDYDRCARIGRSHVCRRCLWFWPVCLATTVLALTGIRWSTSLDPWLLALLPVPVVAEWWGEHLHRLGYSASRQVVLTVIAAPAVGVGLARYLVSPGDGLFWTVVGVYAVVCLVPVLIGARSARGAGVRPASPVSPAPTTGRPAADPTTSPGRFGQRHGEDV